MKRTRSEEAGSDSEKKKPEDMEVDNEEQKNENSQGELASDKSATKESEEGEQENPQKENSQQGDKEGEEEEEEQKEGDEENNEEKESRKKKKVEQTTASTSSAAEEGRAFYEKKLKDLKQEKASLTSGTHQALIEGKHELAIKRDRLLKDAALNMELRIKEIQGLYDFDVKVAQESFTNALNELKENLLSEVNESIKRMEDLRDGITDSGEVRSSQRKTRSKKPEGEEDVEEPAANGPSAMGAGQGTGQASGSNTENSSKAPQYAGFGSESLSGLNFFMLEDAVANDLRAIQQDWKTRAENFLQKSEIMEQSVRVSDGVLYLNEMILEKDADVVCSTEVTKEEVYGTIQSLNSTEITVKLVDGTQTRILVKHLRSGRCSIAPVEEEP